MASGTPATQRSSLRPGRLARLAAPLLAGMVLAGPLLAGEAAPAPLQAQAQGEIALEGMRLHSADRPICVITGEWPGGAPLHYQAWDECAKLTVRRVAGAEVAGAPSLGMLDDLTVEDIPPGAPIVEIANAYSTVIIFPDAEAITREILISD